MKRYSVYKDSGVRWIGRIPEHWSVAKIKFSDSVIMGQSPSSEDYNDSMIGLPFLQGNADFTSLYPVPRIWCDTAKKQTTTGDVLLSVRAPIGAVNVADQDYGIGRGLCAIRSLKTDSKLLFYLALSLNGELNSQGTGSTFTAIAADDVGNSKIPSIDSQEQGSIVEYLDHKTHLIDTLNEKKQKQIELLQEQRAAIINQTVTKGLNPKVKMKDSGIEWLDEVPEHWNIASLRWYLRIGSGEFLSNTDFEAQEQNRKRVPVIGGNGVMGYANKVNIIEPTIAIGRVGALCGNVHLVDPPAWITDNALRLSGIRGFQITSLLLLLMILDINRLANPNAPPLITGNMIKSQKVPVPPLSEQNMIVEHCSKVIQQIDSVLENIQNQILAISEYRTTLISEVVTGKIDVRNEVIP